MFRSFLFLSSFSILSLFMMQRYEKNRDEQINCWYNTYHPLIFCVLSPLLPVHLIYFNVYHQTVVRFPQVQGPEQAGGEYRESSRILPFVVSISQRSPCPQGIIHPIRIMIPCRFGLHRRGFPLLISFPKCYIFLVI